MEENNHSGLNSDTIPANTPLTVDAEIRSYLKETARWGRLLSIVGFVASALIALAGIAILILHSTTTTRWPSEFVAATRVSVSVVYILIGLIYYFPSKYLYDFSNYTRSALLAGDQESLVLAFSKLKSFYKFCGIATVIMIIVYFFAFAFGLLLGFAK